MIISLIVARSAASLHGCKPNLKNWPIFEAFVMQVFRRWVHNRNNRYNFGVFDGKYTWAYKKILKISKVCLRTYYIAGHLKQPRGPHAAWAALFYNMTSINIRRVENSLSPAARAALCQRTARSLQAGTRDKPCGFPEVASISLPVGRCPPFCDKREFSVPIRKT